VNSALLVAAAYVPGNRLTRALLHCATSVSTGSKSGAARIRPWRACQTSQNNAAIVIPISTSHRTVI
jgi:hypothetical protein